MNKTEEKWELLVEQPAKTFARSLEYALKAASKDRTRPHLCSVLLIEGGGAVGTDGHRLHVAHGETVSEEKKTVLIHKDHTSNLVKLAKKEPGAVEVYVSAEFIRVRAPVGGWEYKFKLFDERFPPFEQVIPKKENCSLKVEVSSEDFVAALKKVKGTRENRTDPIKIEVEGKYIKLSREDGENSIAIRRGKDPLDGSFSAGYRPEYLIDATPPGAGLTTLFLIDELSPLLIEHDQGNTRAVVMPMRLK